MAGAEKPEENWPGTFKAIGLKALTTGQFWLFCGLCMVLAFVWRIDSKDWVTIFTQIFSQVWVAVAGWVLTGVAVIAGIMTVRYERSKYLAEIQRIVDHRNDLQKLLAKREFESSKQQSKALPKPKER